MLCRMLDRELPAACERIYLANPNLGPHEILHAIAFELGLNPPVAAAKPALMHLVHDYLLAKHAANRRVVMFVEEAQAMPNATLDAAFRIDDCVRVIMRGGHAIVVIRTEICAAEIALQGAQILSWKPAGHEDLLWCAPLPAAQAGKAIRGGIPVCWPWFGPHATDPALPQHGLVRTVDWRLIATERVAGDVRVDFETSLQDSRLRMAITAGARLRVAAEG